MVSSRTFLLYLHESVIMPVYESSCQICGTRHEYVQTISRYLETPECCGAPTVKGIYTPPVSQFDIQPWDSYVSPATGKLITSKSERKADMLASGSRDWEGMKTEKEEAARRKAYQDAAEDAKLDVEVRKTWAQLPKDKQDILLAS